MHIHPLAFRRIRAHALDCVAYAGIAVASVPVGLVLLRLTTPSRPLTTALSFAPPALATIAAAAAESGPHRATWGKRGLRLQVCDASTTDLVGRPAPRDNRPETDGSEGDSPGPDAPRNDGPSADRPGPVEPGPDHAVAGPEDTTAPGTSLPFPRALLRNAVKVALPWQLGHMVAIGAFYGGFENEDRTTIIATVLTYPVLGVLLAAVALGSGRGLEDRLAGSIVQPVAATRS